MLNLNFNYIDCEDKDLRDKMFISKLKKCQVYYMCSVEHGHRKEVKKAFDFQLDTVVQYLKLVREEEQRMKNKDNGIVLFNGKYESPLWLKPYKIVNGKVISGYVINGAWSFTKKYLQEPNYYVTVPAEVT